MHSAQGTDTAGMHPAGPDPRKTPAGAAGRNRRRSCGRRRHGPVRHRRGWVFDAPRRI